MVAESFLQSEEWERIQQRMGRKTRRAAGFLLIRHDLPLGFHYWYCPRPVLDDAICDAFFEEAEAIARQDGALCLKIDLLSDFDVVSRHLPIANRRHVFDASLQPKKTVILDLSDDEQTLLARMHQKMRYNIGLARRRGVVVTHHEAPDDDTQKIFCDLLAKTARRDGFGTHPPAYYGCLLSERSDSFRNELACAMYNGRIIAAALVNYHGPDGVATYLHGASSKEYKEVMASHLLHWEMAMRAKNAGFRAYDLWGIDEKRWPGVTRFKLGFGGRVAEYPEALIALYRPLAYTAYRAVKKLRGIFLW